MVDLNKQGTTIILTTHYLEEAEQLCRNIAIINKGEIVQSTSVRALLSQLTTETFVFDLNETVSPDIQLSGFPVTVTGDDSLEVTVEKGQSINDIFGPPAPGARTALQAGSIWFSYCVPARPAH